MQHILINSARFASSRAGVALRGHPGPEHRRKYRRPRQIHPQDPDEQFAYGFYTEDLQDKYDTSKISRDFFMLKNTKYKNALAIAIAGLVGLPPALATTYTFRQPALGVKNPIVVTSFNIAGGTSVNLRTAALAAGWNGTGAITATVTSNIGATNTSTAALTIDGEYPAGVSLIVNPGVYIVGAGGRGVAYGKPTSGGLAISVTVPVSITNNGIIGGGGGGGAGDLGGVYGGPMFGSGGAGLPAGSGWRVGTLTIGGAANTGADLYPGAGPGVAGRDTPSWNHSGGGGGLGARGGNYLAGVNGAAGGAATSGNANITWTVTGARYGALN